MGRRIRLRKMTYKLRVKWRIAGEERAHVVSQKLERIKAGSIREDADVEEEEREVAASCSSHGAMPRELKRAKRLTASLALLALLEDFLGGAVVEVLDGRVLASSNRPRGLCREGAGEAGGLRARKALQGAGETRKHRARREDEERRRLNPRSPRPRRRPSLESGSHRGDASVGRSTGRNHRTK